MSPLRFRTPEAPATPEANIAITSGEAQDISAHNQDRHLNDAAHGLFAIFDGDHTRVGDATMTADLVRDAIKTELQDVVEADDSAAGEKLLKDAMNKARAAADTTTGVCTAVVAKVLNINGVPTLFTACAGDSVAILLREDNNQENAANPQNAKNNITLKNYLGKGKTGTEDAVESWGEVKPGYRIVLASRGLFGKVGEDEATEKMDQAELTNVLTANTDAQTTADNILALGKKTDDKTVIMVNFDEKGKSRSHNLSLKGAARSFAQVKIARGAVVAAEKDLYDLDTSDPDYATKYDAQLVVLNERRTELKNQFRSSVARVALLGAVVGGVVDYIHGVGGTPANAGRLVLFAGASSAVYAGYNRFSKTARAQSESREAQQTDLDKTQAELAKYLKDKHLDPTYDEATDADLVDMKASLEAKEKALTAIRKKYTLATKIGHFAYSIPSAALRPVNNWTKQLDESKIPDAEKKEYDDVKKKIEEFRTKNEPNFKDDPVYQALLDRRGELDEEFESKYVKRSVTRSAVAGAGALALAGGIVYAGSKYGVGHHVADIAGFGKHHHGSGSSITKTTTSSGSKTTATSTPHSSTTATTSPAAKSSHSSTTSTTVPGRTTATTTPKGGHAGTTTPKASTGGNTSPTTAPRSSGNGSANTLTGAGSKNPLDSLSPTQRKTILEAAQRIKAANPGASKQQIAQIAANTFKLADAQEKFVKAGGTVKQFNQQFAKLIS